MKEFKRGQIWLVNFDPSFGHEYQKIRPALVVQDGQYAEQSSLVTVVPVSSQIDKFTSLDVLVKKDKTNRLAKDSLVKMTQISSFDKRRFFKLIGEVNKDTMQSISENLQKYLHL